ncbi:MAG: endolytic transglycosylase MltG [Acidobacteria bacterium]|nr:endolytic transglycosylase MltG [Acidobacteriota bacterium]
MVKRLLAVAVVVVAVAAAAGAAWIRQRVNEPYRGYPGAEQFVEIPAGAGPRSIAQRLVAAGVVRDGLVFRAALWLNGGATRLQAGEYRFDRPMRPGEVIDMIVRGQVFVVTITFPEGLTIDEMARIFERQGLGTSRAFAEAARDPAPIRQLDPDARDLEGYLFPETYAVPRRTDAAGLVRQMVDRLQRVLTPELRRAAAARGLTVRQAVTLASIVEKETGRPEERPLVAAVYANRLRIGMPLQCDPTVIYAMQMEGRYRGNITKADLSLDSPYNTYRHPGLPPGPIAAPGRGALEAAIAPADADFLYFVSRNDGSHEFARTLAEHNRNVRKYQVQYFRDRRAARQRAGS